MVLYNQWPSEYGQLQHCIPSLGHLWRAMLKENLPKGQDFGQYNWLFTFLGRRNGQTYDYIPIHRLWEIVWMDGWANVKNMMGKFCKIQPLSSHPCHFSKSSLTKWPWWQSKKLYMSLETWISIHKSIIGFWYHFVPKLPAAETNIDMALFLGVISQATWWLIDYIQMCP